MMTTDFDAFYTAFEAKFRGSFDVIKARSRVYLNDLPRGSDAKVLDLGCGRGEWLDLMRDEGIAAEGVDMNQQFAAPGTDRGLNIRIGDIFDLVSTLPADSFTAVTAFHVIEHLSLQQQLTLLKQAHRILRPGGVLIAEWPNTANWLVMREGFWLDPTHVRPLPMALMAFMAEHSGFERVEQRVYRRTPLPQGQYRPGVLGRLARAWRVVLNKAESDPALECLRNAVLSGEDAAILARKT
jgi:O-antigen chain-terminating methyltransferase